MFHNPKGLTLEHLVDDLAGRCINPTYHICANNLSQL